MKIVTKTVLIIDRDKPAIPSGKEVDLPKKLADELLSRDLVVLPVVKDEPENNEGSDIPTGDD